MAGTGDSLRRDLTVDEEEKTEKVIDKFVEEKDEESKGIEANLSSREEFLHSIKYMRQMIWERESKYAREIEMLKKQVNDLSQRMTN